MACSSTVESAVARWSKINISFHMKVNDRKTLGGQNGSNAHYDSRGVPCDGDDVLGAHRCRDAAPVEQTKLEEQRPRVGCRCRYS